MLRPTLVRAANFKEGKARLLASKKPFQVILLDLTLPDKSGQELITEIVPLSQGAPIIVLTGNSDISFSIKSLSLGVSDYLHKDDLSASSLYKSILYSMERKRKSAELEESEKRYSDLFHMSPQPMWVNEIDTFEFRNVNAAAIKNYGYSQEEFLGMKVMDILPKEDIPKMKENARLAKLSDGFFKHGAFRHLKKNGEIMQVDVQSNVIKFNGKKARLVIATDVTERVNYIQAIEKQNQNLREIAWLQSHIVRAPLTRMMMIVDILKNHQDDAINQEELMDRFLGSAHELDGIIREISNKTKRN